MTPASFWILPEEGGARLGFDPEWIEAAEERWVHLDLATPGATVRAGESFGFLTTARRTHDLRAPRDLRVLEVNPRVLENPQLARLSPTGQGWLLKVALVEATRV